MPWRGRFHESADSLCSVANPGADWCQRVHALSRLDQIGARGPRLEKSAAQQCRWLANVWRRAAPGRREQVVACQRDVVAEQLEPIGDAARAEHALQPGWIAAADGAAAEAPETERLESENDELPLAGEHPIHFAHDGVRIGFELERVWEDDRVDRAVGDGQLGKPGTDVGLGLVGI